MDKSRRKPEPANAEKVVRIICMIVNETLKVVLAWRGGR